MRVLITFAIVSGLIVGMATSAFFNRASADQPPASNPAPDGYWLMIYVPAWAHIFGYYSSEAECQGAALKALDHTCPSTQLFTRTPNCGCVPKPAAISDQ